MSEKFKTTQQEIAPNENTSFLQPVDHKKKKVAAFFRLSSTRKITYMAVLIALAIVIKIFSLTLPVAKISLFYIPVYLAGALFGPVFGFVVGAGADMIGGFVNFGFSINPLITLSNGLMGAVMGGVFYIKCLKPYAKLIIGALISLVICSFGLTTLALALLNINGQISLWQNYWYRLVIVGAPMSRIVMQPIVIVINVVIVIPLYTIVRNHIAKTLA